MEAVKAFNNELSSLYESRPPISKAKMTSITRSGIKAIKLYKHVVQSVEKFIQKCKPEYKVPGLYVIDSIVRQSRHQFTPEKDVFAPRFARNIQQTFLQLFNCPQEDKGKIVRVLNLWQKNQVFTPDVIQPLLDMASLANKDQLVVPSNSNGVQLPPTSTQPRTPTTKPSPVKEPSWLTSSVDINSTNAQPVPVPTMASKLQPSSSLIDPNIMQQLQNLQNLLLDKQLDVNSLQSKKDDTVKFDKKLLDFDYDDDDDEPPSPQQAPQATQPLPSIDSLQTILSNPEVLRQLQTLQQQMSSRQQQAEMEDKMRRLQEMRHQEEEFDKHLAQTLPNLPFASECDFKPSSSSVNEVLSPATLVGASSQVQQSGQTLGHVDPNVAVNFAASMTAPPPAFGINIIDSDDRQSAADCDERNRGLHSGTGSGGTATMSSGINDDTAWDSKIGNSSQSAGDCIEIIDLIRQDSPVKSPTRSSRRRRSPSPRRSSRRSKTRSRSRSRRRRSRTRSRSRSRSRSKSREDRERERERRRRGLPPLKKNHLAVCSTTLWIGHLSKLVQQEELSDTFGEFGDIVSINLIPPRGCAFICMNRRQDASKALQQLKHYKLQGKAITMAWAPGKGMKDREWKDYWEVDHGVSYIPWNKISVDTDLDMLEDGGVIDEDSLPEFLKSLKRETTVKQQNYVNQMQQQQQQQQHHQQQQQHLHQHHRPPQHMMKLGDEKDDLKSHEPPSRNEMEMGNPPPNSAMPPAYIPLPDNSLGRAPPTAQPPPGMPPPMGLLPPFALPPRLLGPMGPMGPLGMGNVPLGVPPPLMMPPPPQQMVGRLPPPFNPPPQMGLMPPPNMTSADNIDKSKLTQIPPPPTPDTFPDLSSMVNPFGIPLPTIPNFNSPNLIPQTQPPPLSQPVMNKTSNEMEVNISETKSTENKEVTPQLALGIDKSANPFESNEVNNAGSSDRITNKEHDRNSSTGTSGNSNDNIMNTANKAAGKKDCDWREGSPRRRERPDRNDRNEREEKRRRRETTPSNRDDRRNDRRNDDRRTSGSSTDDRRSGDERRSVDDRRGGNAADRRGGSASRWPSRQNKWQDDKEGNRPDKDERPSLLPLPHPDIFHLSGPSHHEQQAHFKQGGHHEPYQSGPPKHHDQHYQQGPMGPLHEQYQQGSLKPHHDYPPQSPHDQHYQGPMMPPHYRQHEQHDRFPHSPPPLGFGSSGGRYPDSERDEMMGPPQNSEYPPPRGYFNRGHGRMPPPRSPRPLLRLPNGPMFGPRGPPGPPPPMNMRGHRPGPPGSRMDAAGFLSPRGFPPPGIRGRGSGRFSGGVGREEWADHPQSRGRRGWDDFPPNHPGPPSLMGHGGGGGGSHIGPPPQGHTGSGGASGGSAKVSLLGSPSGHTPRMPMQSGGNLERRRSRWSSTPDKVEQSDPIQSSDIESSKDKSLENIQDNVGDSNLDRDITESDAPSSEPVLPVEAFEPIQDEEGDRSIYSNEIETHADDEYEPQFELAPSSKRDDDNTGNNIDDEMIINNQPTHRLSFDQTTPNTLQEHNEIIDDPAQNLYGDEILPITFEPVRAPSYDQPAVIGVTTGNDSFDDNQQNIDDINYDKNTDNTMNEKYDESINADAPIFEIEKSISNAEQIVEQAADDHEDQL